MDWPIRGEEHRDLTGEIPRVLHTRRRFIGLLVGREWQYSPLPSEHLTENAYGRKLSEVFVFEIPSADLRTNGIERHDRNQNLSPRRDRPTAAD